LKTAQYIIQHILIGFVRLYRCVVSPAKAFIFGPMARCRFEPSCSAYALEALQVHGAARGAWLAAKRLCRCHPWGSFGPDPVPPQSPCASSAKVSCSSPGF
jgi:putative membrane protein insertion efficiency factor